MNFEAPLISGFLVKRYKRFLADVRLEDGTVITAHCPNSGSMKGCAVPGWEVRISKQMSLKRKHPFTWEMVHNGRCWIGINTQVPNRITLEALRAGKIRELHSYTKIKSEVRYGDNCRLDFLAKTEDGSLCYIEVKNVTLVDADGYYAFPDAVTARGAKHLRNLINARREGHHAVMIYVIQRSDGTEFKPAKEIDPAYAEVLSYAASEGVEILPYMAHVTPAAIELTKRVDYVLAP